MMDEDGSFEIDDSQIFAYLEGEADPDVVAAIEQSDTLLDRARQLSRAEDRFTAVLFRFQCPETIILGQYGMGLLSGDEEASIAAHVAECPHCARELALSQTFLGDPEPDPQVGFLSRAKIILARLLGGEPDDDAFHSPALSPAFATRGRHSGPVLYEADEIQISLDIKEDEQQPEYKDLIGLLVGVESTAYKVYLWLDDTLLKTGDVDEAGVFVFTGLSTAVYELLLQGPKVQIYIRKLSV